MDFQTARFNMIEQQIRTWEVLDPAVLGACSELPRDRFVPAESRNLAYADTEIPLAHEQHMMAPKIEARLLQSLDLKRSDRALEIGTGSGYLTALLARLTAHVTSIEYFDDLAEAAKDKLARAGISNVKLHQGDGIHGWSTAEPYDVIAVTGSCPSRRTDIERQLSINGRMFVVVGEAPVMEALLVTRISKDTWSVESLFETELAPLIGAEPAPQFQF